jgi:ADP-ribose pyrophosphatase
MNKKPSITNANKLTDSRFLNMYELDVQHRNGAASKYYVASRAKSTDGLLAVSGRIKSDAVAILGMFDNKLVLIKQYRYPVGDYIYELPAGLIDSGEDAIAAAKREMFEETGLDFVPGEQMLNKPLFSSPGMTDETCAIVIGQCYGTPTNINQESSEDIQVVLADREEAMRILNEELVDMRTAMAIVAVYGLLNME